MNPTQLFNNYYNACVYYAQSNGDNNAVFTLADNGTGTITITSWNSTTTQPTYAQLLAITPAEVLTIAIQNTIQSRLSDNILLPVTNAQITNYLSSPPNGLMILNSSTGGPLINVGGNWQPFANLNSNVMQFFLSVPTSGTAAVVSVVFQTTASTTYIIEMTSVTHNLSVNGLPGVTRQVFGAVTGPGNTLVLDTLLQNIARPGNTTGWSIVHTGGAGQLNVTVNSTVSSYVTDLKYEIISA
jgi:hypothetical protein